jgi:hypothetical protein
VTKRQLKREVIKALLRPLLRWQPLEDLQPGFTIILGTPWQLRHLLAINLRFIARTDTRELQKIHVVFDRTPQPGGDVLIAETRAAFPHLPLEFRFHPPLSGHIVRAANQSKFYASLNFLIKQAGLKRTAANTGAVTLIQRFGSAANLNIHLHCLVLDGVYRNSTAVFHEVAPPPSRSCRPYLQRSSHASCGG